MNLRVSFVSQEKDANTGGKKRLCGKPEVVGSNIEVHNQLQQQEVPSCGSFSSLDCYCQIPTNIEVMQLTEALDYYNWLVLVHTEIFLSSKYKQISKKMQRVQN